MHQGNNTTMRPPLILPASAEAQLKIIPQSFLNILDPSTSKEKFKLCANILKERSCMIEGKRYVMADGWKALANVLECVTSRGVVEEVSRGNTPAEEMEKVLLQNRLQKRKVIEFVKRLKALLEKAATHGLSTDEQEKITKKLLEYQQNIANEVASSKVLKTEILQVKSMLESFLKGKSVLSF